jgi:hypothetical protein
MTSQFDSISAISQVSKDSVVLAKQVKTGYVQNNVNYQSNKVINTSLHVSTKLDKVGFEPDSIPLIRNYIIEPWPEILNTQNNTYSTFLYKKPALVIDKPDSVKVSCVTENNRIQSNSFGYTMDNFILISIIFSFILLAWSKVFFGKYIIQILRAAFNYSEAFKLYRDHTSIVDRCYWLLNIIFTISGGIFLFHLLKIIKPALFDQNPFYTILGCFAFILTIYLSRYLINKIIGYLLNQQETFNEFIHSIFIYLKVMGLALLPLVTIISFVSADYRSLLLILGATIIFLLYIISIFRATRIMFKKGILIFYWILYLCTIEFLPIILLYKFINSVI